MNDPIKIRITAYTQQGTQFWPAPNAEVSMKVRHSCSSKWQLVMVRKADEEGELTAWIEGTLAEFSIQIVSGGDIGYAHGSMYPDRDLILDVELE